MSKFIHLDAKQYQCIVNLYNHNTDHALIYSQEEQCFILFIHGTKDGYIVINNNIYSLEQLGQLLDKTQTNICLKVICCYGAYQSSYITNNVSVTSYAHNKDVMSFKPINIGEKYCYITCVL